jgi:uncharacterized Zn-binding protein involved in type VI secretion
MADRLAAKGDATTTGGHILNGSSTFYNEKGQPFALKYDLATCGKCDGTFPIYGTVNDCYENGKPMVKHRDPVMCPCGNNYVFASLASTVFIMSGGASTTVAPSASPVNAATHWITFSLNDLGNHEGLECIAHFADGTQEHGTFDANNKARFERADNSNACVRIELLSPDGAGTSGSVAEAILSAISG